MAKRRMIGKIAREDSLAIHSYKSNGTSGFIFSLVVQNEARLPCALRCVGRMAAFCTSVEKRAEVPLNFYW